MNMKRLLSLVLMALLLCLPVWAMAEDSQRTVQWLVDGITYQVTYPTSCTCEKNVTHKLEIEFDSEPIGYAGAYKDALVIRYIVKLSDNTCNHTIRKQVQITDRVTSSCTQGHNVSPFKIKCSYDDPLSAQMSIVLLANSEHDYTWEPHEDKDKHYGKCQNGVCTATDSHNISWTEWVSGGKDSHTRECSVTGCTIKEIEDHNFADWTVTKPATTTEVGEEQGKCICNAVTTREIPKLPTPSLPQTGDDSNVILWSALACISVIGMMTLVRKRKEA